MEKWLGYRFDRADYNETGYDKKAVNRFCNDLKKYIKKNIPKNIKIVELTKGYYYVSGFLRNNDNGKYVYFDTGDLRDLNRWYHDMLIRTAEGSFDFSGGRNNFIDLKDFGSMAVKLTE